MFRKILNTLGLCVKEDFDQEQALRIHLEKKLQEKSALEKKQQGIIIARLLEQHMVFADDLGRRYMYISESSIKETEGYDLVVKRDLQNRIIVKAIPKIKEE